MEFVRVGLVGQDRGAIVVREGLGDGLRVVQEVQHEDIVLLRVRAVEPGQGLDRPNPREGLVDVHGVEEGFVVAGLELVRADEEAVRIFLEPLGDLGRGEAVQDGFAHRLPAVVLLTRERDDRLVGALALVQVVADGVEVLDRALDSVGDHHRPRLSVDLALEDHLVLEVVDHDLGLEPDRVLVPLDVAPELLAGLPDIELRVALHRLGELVVALDRRVVLEHVQDEPLLDRLLHAVVVERKMPDRAVALRLRVAEDLQRLVLRRGREGVVAGVGQQLARLHQALEPFIVGLVLAHLVRLAQHGRDCRTGLAALARMRLVNDHRERAPAMLVADLLTNEAELLDCRDDNLLALLDEPAQIARLLGMPHR